MRAKAAIALADDRNGELADHVAAHDEDVRLVVLCGIDELAEDALRAVKIGGKEETRQLPVGLGGRVPSKQRHKSRLPPELSGRLIPTPANPITLHPLRPRWQSVTGLSRAQIGRADVSSRLAQASTLNARHRGVVERIKEDLGGHAHRGDLKLVTAGKHLVAIDTILRIADVAVADRPADRVAVATT